ncbi:hypothetical protein [Arthrobacter sp. SDTb3-6]|uniref:hypothetical protein n=1 Tax=Arthrobacter sp. SDTb3-6 TaxID=2713571 RepID=UPI00159D2B45|nr:hypothetical protein [Arthrobacter sp. SDTb3-6]NVN00775.1 hypothetical protein [Arthrobacter sp. SDTb3-6]
MNSAWAIVVGAIIALVGSVVTPWIREALETKRRQAEIDREDVHVRKQETGVAIRNLMEAFMEQYTARGIPGYDAATLAKRSLMTTLDLGLLLVLSDLAIAPIVSSAGEVISTGSPSAPKVIDSLTSVLTAWRRGQISDWEALDAYRRDTGLEVFVENEERHRASD